MELKQNKESFSFLKNTVFISTFFLVTPLIIFLSLITIIELNKDHKREENDVLGVSFNRQESSSGVYVYASLPSELPSISGNPETADARAEILEEYLDRYHSPLEPYANYIVNVSDRHDLDYRLLVAIAQQESNLCKIIPSETYNCWGWGIHSKGTLRFQSFEQGIETVASGLKKDYIDKGFSTVEEIMSKYTPLSNGSWADGVNHFMEEMESFN